MTRHDLTTIIHLHYRQLRSWLRRNARSPFFWVVIAFIGLIAFSAVASALGSGPGDDLAHLLDAGYFEAASAAHLIVWVLIGLWRGTSSTPRASLADVVVLAASPISARANYAYYMLRDGAANGLVYTLWITIGLGGMLVQTGDAAMPLRLFFVAFASVLIGESLRFSIWALTEHVITSDPGMGRALRSGIRAAVLLGAGAVTGYALLPVIRESIDSWQENLDILVERGETLAMIPPLSWAANVFVGEGTALIPAAGLVALIAGFTFLALYFARDVLEPVAMNAERITDARGQMTEPGVDIQWAAIAQFGITPRARTSVRPLGSGPWAILWASIVRWVRYEIAAAWIGLLILGGFGVGAAVLIRLDVMSEYIGWAVAIIMPMFSSVSSFMDELRKQFIFLTPGSAWARLLAGAVTSVMDGILASLLAIIGLVAVGAIPVLESIGLVIFCAGIAVVSQGAVAFVQVILPYWTPQRIRILLTMSGSVLGSAPALIVMIALYVAGAGLIALIAGALLAAGIGAGMLAIGALFFDRIEFSG